MKIKTRLTLQFAAIFAGILLLFSFVVYFYSDYSRAQDFNGRIRNRAYATAHYVLDADTVSHRQHVLDQRLYYQMLPQEAVSVLDHRQKQIFHEGVVPLEVDKDFLNDILSNGEARQNRGDRQLVGIRYLHRRENYIILASAVDQHNLEKQHQLRTILIFGFLGSMGVVLLCGWVFSKAALYPFLKVVSEVETISASDLHLRLSQASGTDEVAQLAQTFNHMLHRLETAFEAQRTFVSNASHELRTPLTAMIGELEVALMKKRTPEEYERVLLSTLDEAKLLTQLSNGLLQMVQASTDLSTVTMTVLHMDELVWQACAEARKRQPNLQIEVNFENMPDDEQELIIRGSEALLLIAMVNVLENAAKFSQDVPEITASIRVLDKDLVLTVKDQGMGMTPDDVRKVFVPFFRAENVREISGHGIGLPLAEKIITLHKGSIYISSQLNQGTEVTITLPKIEQVYRI